MVVLVQSGTSMPAVWHTAYESVQRRARIVATQNPRFRRTNIGSARASWRR